MEVSEISHLGISFLGLIVQALLISVYQEKLEAQIESDWLRLLVVFLASEIVMLPVSYVFSIIFFGGDVFARTSVLQLFFHYVFGVSLMAEILNGINYIKSGDFSN